MVRSRYNIGRKPLAFLLALFTAVSLVMSGCGQGAPSQKSVSAQTRLAAQRGYILVGMPMPMTGPLAAFGEGVQWAAQRALASINKDGGIYIKSLGKKLPVKVKIMDTQSSATQASQVATELVVKDKVDILLTLWTPDVVNPVTSIAEHYKVPAIALSSTLEPWLAGGPYHWSYLVALTLQNTFDAYVGAWNTVAAKTNKVVGLLLTNDADGVTFEKLCKQKLPALGYKVVDPGTFPADTNDFSSLISRFKQDHVEILVGLVPPPVFAIAWRQMREQGFVPEVATIGKALVFPSDVAALGDDLAEGLTSEDEWGVSSSFKSSLSGETATQLSDAWVKETGKQFVETIAIDYAGFELVAGALNRAQSLDPSKLVRAIGEINLDTMVGPIKFNDQHYALFHQVVGQWIKGKRWPWNKVIVFDKTNPQIPVTAKMIFPLPK